ncbi:MAG TPA: DUF1697 domain-containing protein [Candidatus Nanopelagicales bacterium]|jgi:uncharacterized protein (DUF1697 family)|nr:DUF1697 domain-containing protein [Candidatus Nanopelagicales bacterium]
MRYVVLLRAVNVGGRSVKMADLRKVLTGLGYDDVRTYLQSGNAVITAPRAAPASVAAKIEPALQQAFGLQIQVVVLTAAQLDGVVAANPFGEVESEPTKLVVDFIGEPFPRTGGDTLDLGDLPERGERGDGVVYLHFPDGQGRSKLTPAVLSRALGGRWGTARNWRTVLALQALAAD